ncbi:MAG: hypothetical protein RIQ79_1517 [Verrucomicrobiota bacterium]|jgi:hypothetical protein
MSDDATNPYDPTAVFVHDDRFVEPFANRPHTVLGKRLYPFSVWTQCNLEWAQSPFLLMNRQPNLHDLWVAVQCASTPWTPEHYVPDLRSPGKFRWLWSMRRYNARMELAKFYAYMQDFAVGPKFWPNQHKHGTAVEPTRDCDENLELAVYAEHEFKWTPEVVWTMPIGQLRWRAALVNKFKGGDNAFWTPLDEEAFQAHKAKREAGITERGKELERLNPKLTPEKAREQAKEEYWAKVKQGFDRTDKPQPVPPPSAI